MNDEELVEVWTSFTPTAQRRRRIGAQVSSWLDARDTSLAAEWLELFRVAPFAAFGLTAVSAVALLAAMPLTWLVRALI